jgi:HSP20 family protein
MTTLNTKPVAGMKTDREAAVTPAAAPGRPPAKAEGYPFGRLGRRLGEILGEAAGGMPARAWEGFPFGPMMGFGREGFGWFPTDLIRRAEEAAEAAEEAEAEMLALPPMEVREGPAEIRVKVDLPGIAPEDVEVEVDEDVLTVRAARREERTAEPAADAAGTTTAATDAAAAPTAKETAGTTLIAREQVYGLFERQVRLPTAVNAAEVKAELARGVLEIVLPKAETAKARKVPVTAAGAEGE